MHDAGEFAAAPAELRFGLASQPRSGAGAVYDEDAPNRLPSELLADLVGLVERFERLGDGPEVEGTRLDREECDVGRNGSALRNVAKARRPVEEHVVVAASDLPEAWKSDRPVRFHNGEPV
jgi:hypothetical protein